MPGLTFRKLLVMMRWVLWIIMAGLAATQDPVTALDPFPAAIFVIYALSNIGLGLAPESLVRKKWFGFVQFMFDIGFVTLEAYLAVGWDMNLFLVFFLVIFMSAFEQSMPMTLGITFIASLVYLTRLEVPIWELSWVGSDVMMRLIFFYVVALFASFLAREFRNQQEQLATKLEAGRKAGALAQREAKESKIGFQKAKARVAELTGVGQRQAQFFGSAAQQLRRSLSLVKKNLETLRGKGTAITSSETTEGLMKLQQGVVKLEGLAEYLLLVHDIDYGTLKLNKAPMSVRYLVDYCRKVMEAYRTTHAFQYQVSDDPGSISCDAVYIQQALWHLLTNAVKFSPKSGVIEMNVGLQSESVVFSIIDGGKGILPQDKEHIFEKFQRGSQPYVAKIPGVGIGLYVAKNIAEAHDGSLELTNSKTMGCVARLTLPASVADILEPPVTAEGGIDIQRTYIPD